MTAVIVGDVEASTPYLSLGILRDGVVVSESARVTCHAPELLDAFRAEPVARVVDLEGAPHPDAARFALTLRPADPAATALGPGALWAWDLEATVTGFPGAGRNRVQGRVELVWPEPGGGRPRPEPVRLVFNGYLTP